jgi:hypothetical protein
MINCITFMISNQIFGCFDHSCITHWESISLAGTGKACGVHTVLEQHTV